MWSDCMGYAWGVLHNGIVKECPVFLVREWVPDHFNPLLSIKHQGVVSNLEVHFHRQQPQEIMFMYRSRVLEIIHFLYGNWSSCWLEYFKTHTFIPPPNGISIRRWDALSLEACGVPRACLRLRTCSRACQQFQGKEKPEPAALQD